MSQDMIEELKFNYGYLFEEELLNEINQVGVFREVPENSILIDIGTYAAKVLQVLDFRS